VDRFVRRENVRHYRELLKTVKDEAERQRLLKLLAEEQQKQKDAATRSRNSFVPLAGFGFNFGSCKFCAAP
jgi:hypothetical protein